MKVSLTAEKDTPVLLSCLVLCLLKCRYKRTKSSHVALARFAGLLSKVVKWRDQASLEPKRTAGCAYFTPFSPYQLCISGYLLKPGVKPLTLSYTERREVETRIWGHTWNSSLALPPTEGRAPTDRIISYKTASLRSKRFRLVWEQNGIFDFGRERNGTRANLSFHPPAQSFTRAIFRAIFNSPSSFFASKQHWKACYAGYKTAYLFTWIDRVPLACVQTSPPPSGKNRNRNPDFFLREEGTSVHGLSSVHTKLDLPTSRAQIFSQARSASGRFFKFSAAKANQRAKPGNEKRRTLRKSNTKPVNPLIKTASFWNRSPEPFQAQFTRIRKKRGFQKF